MLVLQEVIEQTNDVFGDLPTDEMVVPEPSPHWHRKLEAFEEAKLFKQRASAIFDMRCEQAESMGFKQLTAEEAVEMLMKEPHTDEVEEAGDRQSLEWAYNHHTNKLLGKSWGSHPNEYYRLARHGLWHKPPFQKFEKWRCRTGKLDYLKREIPYGIVLRIQEAKKLQLFNAFTVVAPVEAWLSKTDLDPIVMAEIWTLPPDDDGEHTVSGQKSYFFLAQWE